MKKLALSILILAFVSALAGCSKSSFDYLGKSYTLTTNPEIFFREQDVPSEKYEVMGKVMAEVPYSKKLDYIQKKIEKVAREHGAHGKVSIGGGGRKTQNTEMKSLEATLLKYK